MSHDIEIERFNFFVLPNNTSGSVSQPIALSPGFTVLATLGLHCRDFDHGVILTATVGWLAVTDGTDLDRVNVLFKIWRGAPGHGNLIFSADDSGESGFDSRKVTSFTHVDARFDHRSEKSRSYTLTAELPDPGSAATVIGPITFVATELEED